MIVVQEGNSAAKVECNQARDRKWWVRVSIYALFVLSGESVATLLGGLYYNKGGNSKWVATLVQIAGFPMLLPYYCLSSQNSPKTNNVCNKAPKKYSASRTSVPLVYTSLGLINGAVCLFHSIGLSCLPISTYSLICATQLSFSALFSFFLNSQKFTPYILNSLVLLTLSSILLLFQPDLVGHDERVSRRTYVIGFVFTLFGSAGYGLVLSLTQFVLQRVLKRESTLSAIMDMTIYVSLASTLATLVGLFCSGDWKTLRREMEGFELGQVSYVVTLTSATVSWQVFNIGVVGLILEVSSLFSNVISVLSLPVVPVLGVVFFDERIDGVKMVSMVLAVWGLMSYCYQHYLEIKPV